MTIYFLGTGTSQGVPVIGCKEGVCLSEDIRDRRLRVSVWIATDDASIVVDCGPDFRQQMLASKCEKIDAILFTHEHADHTAGLDDIRPFNFVYGDMPIFAHQRVLQNLEMRFQYIFETENKYPGAPSVITNEVFENQDFTINKTTVRPIKAWHGTLPIFGYRIGDFAYLTDIKTIDADEMEKLKNLKLLVINALRIEPHPTHFNLEEALDFIKKINPKKSYLTHISHTFGFHQDIENNLPENVFLAYDNLILNV
ncbi:MBL fold metallo-hydrolase [Flavobacterium branchiophilum]|uniref:MBL fold metallo-hydrolase n=1 Tax=Flavobacterium branchiophilum TaxID=55197 RepID=A0A2H3KRI3_9FLAO|nr:MBL fold metallo-hydrolase [Flavobacterium branchiophilum]PDS21694.1 MBL fold metallo-hydrolase [Flavobacterium branchiophilum]